jgi:tripartite-type tricarboxylate transporter receptor subunit TctC
METRRRSRLPVAVFVGAVLAMLSGSAAWSQTPLKLVVPYPPASGPDILSRLMSDQFGHIPGAPTVVVENRPGGGTLIGTEAVARAAPDGTTVLLAANSFVVNPALKKVSYDPTTSFEPVCYLASTPIVLVVDSASPYNTFNDFITTARAKPGELSVAGAPASSLQVFYEVIKRAANVNLVYVPFAGTAPAINALIGGHVNAVSADYPTVVPHLQSGRLRALVTASHARAELLPNVPTLNETGLTKYEADIFYGTVAPAKTPPGAISQLTTWFTTALKAPDMKPKLTKQGLISVGSCGAEFGAYLNKQSEEYARIIREAGIKAE